MVLNKKFLLIILGLGLVGLILAQPVRSSAVYKPHYVFMSRAEILGLDQDSFQVLSDDRLYNIKIDSVIGLFSRWGWGLNLDDFATGNEVQIWGRQIDPITIEAKLIRNPSLQRFGSVILGTVRRVSGDGTSITVQSDDYGFLEVYLSHNSVIVNPQNYSGVYQLRMGDKVVVKGLLDKANSRVNEVSKVVVLPPMFGGRRP